MSDEHLKPKPHIVQAQAARTICDVHQAEFDRLEEQLALSMARQETLASNVNDGLLEHRALREQLAQAEEEIACLNLQKEER